MFPIFYGKTITIFQCVAIVAPTELTARRRHTFPPAAPSPEQCSKALLVHDYRGLYYPLYIGDYDNPSCRGIPLLTNDYNGMTEGFCGHFSLQEPAQGRRPEVRCTVSVPEDPRTMNTSEAVETAKPDPQGLLVK